MGQIYFAVFESKLFVKVLLYRTRSKSDHGLCEGLPPNPEPREIEEAVSPLSKSFIVLFAFPELFRERSESGPEKRDRIEVGISFPDSYILPKVDPGSFVRTTEIIEEMKSLVDVCRREGHPSRRRDILLLCTLYLPPIHFESY